MNPLFTSIFTVLITSGLTWVAGRGYIAPGAVGDLAAGVVGLLGSGVVAWQQRPKNAVKTVAAAEGTEVSARGATIELKLPELREAAVKAATDLAGRKVK